MASSHSLLNIISRLCGITCVNLGNLSHLQLNFQTAEINTTALDLMNTKNMLGCRTLKPTATRVTPFAAKAKSAPRSGGFVPPFCVKLILYNNKP